MNFEGKKTETVYNVIFSWTYTVWGGAQIYFLSIIKNAPVNWRFTIVLPKNSKQDIIKFFEPYGVKFEFLEPEYELHEARGFVNKINRQRLRINSEISVFKKLCGLNLKNRIFHLESAPWQSWILLFLLSKKSPVFVTMHNALPREVPNWRRKLWSSRLNILLKQKNFKILAANQDAIESLKKYVAEKFWDKLILTRASINLGEIENARGSEFDKISLLKKHNLPTNKFIVLCVGQFIDRKGRWVFLEAVRKIVKTEQEIFFVWLTPQLPAEDDQKRISEFGVDDFFKIVLSADLGKNREDVLRFFRIADVFTLPSLWEGLPIAILEAMSLGIPTISTDLNAIPEAVKHKETGLLVKIGDSEDLAEAVLELFSDRKLRESLGIMGQKFVAENFDERYWAQVALENYQKCLMKQ